MGRRYFHKMNEFVEVCNNLKRTIRVENTGACYFNYYPFENRLIASPVDSKLFEEHNRIKTIAISCDKMAVSANSKKFNSFSINDFIKHIEENRNIKCVYVLVDAEILAHKDDPHAKELLLALENSSKIKLDYTFF